jgi:hypothetical protein
LIDTDVSESDLLANRNQLVYMDKHPHANGPVNSHLEIHLDYTGRNDHPAAWLENSEDLTKCFFLIGSEAKGAIRYDYIDRRIRKWNLLHICHYKFDI